MKYFNNDTSLKEWKKYAKKFKDFPPDHAYEAYKNEYYIEAAGILHGFIESQMRSIFFAFSTKSSNTQEKLIWDTTESFDFKNISNILFVLQLINKKQHDILFSLNSLRNQIIHKYFYDPFEKDYHGISKTKFHSIFKSAYNLSWKISELNEKMYSIESLTSVKRNNE